MKNDIQHRKDISLIMKEFYVKLLSDDFIKHFFEHIIQKKELENHLEIITDFWNDILFSTFSYQRNAMQPHLNLNKTIPFKKEHFDIWLSHLTTTIDQNFKGTKAELMKTRALSIATVMQIKMINQ